MEQIIEAGNAARRKLEIELQRRFDLTYSQFTFMKALLKAGAVPLGRLAELVGCTRGNATVITDGLEKRCYVARVRSGLDRRVVDVQLLRVDLATAAVTFVREYSAYHPVPPAAAQFLQHFMDGEVDSGAAIAD